MVRYTTCLAAIFVALACVSLRGEGEAGQTPTFAADVADLGSSPIEFDTAWRSDRRGELSKAGQAALKLARRGNGYWKTVMPGELSQPGGANKHLSHNLDVGRHEVLKSLLTKATQTANKRLAAAHMSPLKRVQTVNSGSTGNATRDIDMTAMVGEGMREHIFMESLEAEAKGMGLAQARYDRKAGLSIPELEVEMHRGSMSPPQLHECLDLQEFMLKYDKVVEAQVRNPEAYIGGGAVTEVQGRATQTFKPGKTYVQTFEVDAGGATTYRGDKAMTPREAQALLATPLRERYTMGERAMNIYCGYREAIHHESTGDRDFSKGPLKYTGRALDQLCEIQGRKPYAQLSPEERLDVAASVFEPGALEDPSRRKVVERMVKTLDRLPETLAEAKRLGAKAAGDPASPLSAESGVARIFLRQAAARTVGRLAREMMNPPYDPKFVDEMIKSQNWDNLNARQRVALARRLDENYRKAVSAMAMTDLLAVTWTLHTMDLTENDPHGTRPGRTALRQLIEAESNPKMRKLLELAEEHGRLAVVAECAADPKARVAARNQMVRIRTDMFVKAAETPSPGKAVIERAAEMGPRSYVKRMKEGVRPSWEPELIETRGRMTEMISKMVGDEESAGVRQKLKIALDAAAPHGAKAYLRERLKSEVFSLGTIVDGLSLIELYQNGASNSELASAFGIQVISRAHWSIGFLRAAVHLDLNDEAGWKALGKEAAFWTAAHYLPQVMGTMKLVFDIELGLIKVTLLPAMNALDDTLIDALYTGTAGRAREGMANWGSRYREGVDAILHEKLLVHSIDSKTKKPVVDIDRMRLFDENSKAWFGMDWNDERITTVSPDPLLKAFAGYLKIRQEQLESHESTWVVEKEFRPASLPEKGKVREAFDRLRGLLAHKCEADVDRVLAESGARKSVRFGSSEDRIRAGLIERYSSDVLLGMEWMLQTDLAEKAMARRHLERTAALADLEQIARTMAESMEPAEGKAPGFELEVGVEHPALTREFDGTEPLPLTCQLRLRGERPAGMENARLEIAPGAVKNLSDPSGAPKAGDIVQGPVTVRALVGGKEIASKTVDLRVRLGPPRAGCEFYPVKERAPGEPIGISAKVVGLPKKVSFRWNLGDGTTQTTDSAYVDHIYQKTGEYDVKMEIIDETGKSPKVVAAGSTRAKIRIIPIMERVKLCGGFSTSMCFEGQRKNEEKRPNLTTGMSNQFAEGSKLTWSGNGFTWTYERNPDHPNANVEKTRIEATFSEDGRTVTKLSYRHESRQKNGGYEFKSSWEASGLICTNVGLGNDPALADYFVFDVPNAKLAENVRDLKQTELRMDTSTGKVWDDRSIVSWSIGNNPRSLHHVRLVMRIDKKK